MQITVKDEPLFSHPAGLPLGNYRSYIMALDAPGALNALHLLLPSFCCLENFLVAANAPAQSKLDPNNLTQI